jgi:methylenetetrahydrofolate--tRNA-(uracil-5-)-methyltransferase
LLSGKELVEAPVESATGALARYVSSVETKNFQPVNITFGLLPPLSEPEARRTRKKSERRKMQVELGLQKWVAWLQEIHPKEMAYTSAE